VLSAEAESGTVAGTAASADSSAASGGRAVRFGDTAQLFSPDSYHNAKLPANTAVDPQSAAVVADLVQQVTEQGGANVNRSQWTTPVYTVGPTQATRKVSYPDASADSKLQAAWNAVPLPAGALPDPEADAHLTVWQPSTDTLWEFWGFSYVNGQPQALYGGRMQNVSTNPGHFIDDGDNQSRYWGATATSIPLLAGLIRTSEVKALHIPHVLGISTKRHSCQFRSPAQRADGTCTPGTSVLPEGALFRLPANTDIDSLGLPPFGKAVALAARDYGIVVRDRGAVTFYAERSTTEYAGVDFNLDGFPWSRLQLLPPQD
jgi:hypothetical protein